jgi:hypothetical protein
MQGDFTRNTFDPTKHFSRVLMQQGRVQLDADWNEQTAILLHTLRTLTRDLFGKHGGPGQGAGFAITGGARDFKIGEGHYYVDGILVENDVDCWYRGGADLPTQPDHQPKDGLADATQYLVYLDVWERHISPVEDDDIREKALLGPDTATRAKVVWQVKVEKMNAGEIRTCGDLAATLRRQNLPLAKARVKPTVLSTDPCIQAPDARYRGAENQLYRVEVHQGSEPGKTTTFKWSRDNGSVIFPIVQMNGAVATLEHLGRDARLGLHAGDWVEVVDDDQTLRGDPGPMLQVDAIDPVEMKVTLKTRPGVAPQPYDETSSNHPYLRRWDHKAGPLGAVPVVEDNADQWLDLEDGVQVQFQPGGDYRSGDYWLLPARTATGQVEWPGPVDAPQAQEPQGILHHIAPLAQIEVDGAGVVTVPHDCRFVMTSAMHGL